MDDDVESSWKLFESDPACFKCVSQRHHRLGSDLNWTEKLIVTTSHSELLGALGVRGLIVDDLYSLDNASLSALQPLHALVFLFKWVAGADEKGGGTGQYDNDFGGFFMRQTVNNACATIAVLNGLCNIPGVEMGTDLTQLIEFSSGLDYETKGEVFTSSDWLRTAHNSLIPPSAVSLDNLGLPKTSEDAYHFVVYLPQVGSVYELDGLKRAPVNHGAYNESADVGWAQKAREVIEARIATYPPGSVHFNLLAIRSDPLPIIQTQLNEANAKGQSELVRLLEEQMMVEKEKRDRWAFDNSVRRHNHLGLIYALLSGMSQTGGLDKAVEGAKARYKELLEKEESKRETQ
ncbi:hypothetical protein FRB93_003406 [Tulasnella sp. JGI-2019a]|nr:hypothetical protein FRB93_003406 [Tulasnella sp. JGI-2019a]